MHHIGSYSIVYICTDHLVQAKEMYLSACVTGTVKQHFHIAFSNWFVSLKGKRI